MKLRKGSHEATGLKFGIVASKFNKFVTSRLLAEAIKALTNAGAKEEDLEVVCLVDVPVEVAMPDAVLAVVRDEWRLGLHGHRHARHEEGEHARKQNQRAQEAATHRNTSDVGQQVRPAPRILSEEDGNGSGSPC